MLEVLAPLEDWVSSRLGLPGWLLTPTVILALALAADLFTRLVVWRGVQLLEKTRNRWDDTLLLAVRRPLWVGIWGTAIVGMASLLAERFGNQWASEHAPTALWLFMLAMIGWSGIRLTRLIEKRLVFPPAKHPGRPLDASTASAISKLIGATILTLVILAMLQALGMSISGLLAFGGAGGLIVGFAARNVLSNFFGGLAIHLDNPFKVGDWVSSPDREIEGVVEDIGWRLTRIRTFDSRPLYVPNMIFGSIAVVNPSRMLNRRIFETLGLRYRDIGEVGDIVAQIRHYLEQHDSIDQDNLLLVNFYTYGAYSLDILIHAYTHTTDWGEHQAIKQEVLLRIAAIVDEAGAAIAMPSRELHLSDGLPFRQAEEAQSSKEDAEASQYSGERPPSTLDSSRHAASHKERARGPSASDSDANSDA
ncbi:mechanosensitive ion channel family protein [Halomonas sp. HP20-15]|uniref:mechanosensitive ion channel family protein n=1 Tax=Halomonas sp. HP20-15 TaxID=3085901 RepID=UPI002981010A|nr:mechanosensitive ion channel family protein [Halomonas sp. HP20-15]MDW5378067.1 mechanosensitive ion channel family protein [Halomonas sp. HP20-15]